MKLKNYLNMLKENTKINEAIDEDDDLGDEYKLPSDEEGFYYGDDDEESMYDAEDDIEDDIEDEDNEEESGDVEREYNDGEEEDYGTLSIYH